jgi:hypothetical protein
MENIMSSSRLIKSKLQQWAFRNGIELIGSKNTQGEKYYTKKRNDNFFIPPSNITLDDFKKADGQELGNGNYPGKIQALHSSSAIAVNFFEYWKLSKEKELVAKGLNIPSTNIIDIRFEQKFPILDANHKPPNIDVVIQYKNHILCAIESKFTEAYANRKEMHGLKNEYFVKSDLWEYLPNLLSYAKLISPKDTQNKFLHAAQLIKHTLGLINYFGDKSKFRLIYLWYDTLGEEGYFHRKEIETFSDVIKNDGIIFQNITWQELIINMANKYRTSHSKYFDYMTERYL